MTDSLLPIVGIRPAAATVTLIYTAPVTSGNKATVFDLLVLNTDATVADTYELWFTPSAASTPSGQDDQLQNKVVHHQTIAGLERQQLAERFTMLAGGKLFARATNGTLTFRGSVLEQT